MSKYDVYWAYVKYAEDSKRGKRRPVVQIKDNAEEKGAFAKITSSEKGVNRKHALKLFDISSAGLYNEPSAIQINNRLLNKPELSYSGRLCEDDIRQIELYEELEEDEIEYRLSEEFDDDFTLNSILEKQT